MKKLLLFFTILFSISTMAQDTLFITSNTLEVSKAGKRIYKGANILYVRKNLPSNITFGNASSSYDLISPVGVLRVSINGVLSSLSISYDSIYNAIKYNVTSLSTSGGGGGGSFDGQLTQNGSNVSVANPLPVSGTFVATFDSNYQRKVVQVSNFPATQPVSGTFWQATQPVSLSSLPALATGSNTIGSVNVLGGNATAVKVDGSGVTQPVSLDSATQRKAVIASQSGTWNINNISGTVSLPTGAATSANQSTGNTSLSNIDTKTPSLGQATMANSSPVVIASNQSAVPISGTVTATVDSASQRKVVQVSNFPATQTVSGSVTATISGTPTVSVSGTVPVSGTFWQATQPVSLSSLPALATGSNTIGSVNVLGGNATAVKVDGSGVTQPVSLDSATQRKAVIASQSGTWNINNISGTVSLPTGAATSANQSTGNTSLSNIDTKTPSLGQATMANSSPVVIASNQSAVPISGTVTATVDSASQRKVVQVSNFPATQTVSGTVTATVDSATQRSTVQVSNFPSTFGLVGTRPFSLSFTITRPANTTAYSAGQLLSTATSGLTALPTWATGLGNSTKLIVQNVTIISSNGSAATKGQFQVFLFGAASPSGAGFNDAATFNPTASSLSATSNDLIGLIPVSIGSVGNASYGYILTNDTRQVTTDGSGNIYPAVVLNAAYTPASGETITITISGVY